MKEKRMSEKRISTLSISAYTSIHDNLFKMLKVSLCSRTDYGSRSQVISQTLSNLYHLQKETRDIHTP
jgi:hypothetical protein